MSGPEIVPDRLVQAALQLLPVPPHADGFWEELERRLDEADGPNPAGARRAGATAVVVLTGSDPTPVPAPRPIGGPEPSRAVIPPAMRRRSNAVLAAVAAAAAIVVGVAGFAVVQDQTGSGGGTQVADGDQVAAGDLQTVSSTTEPPVAAAAGLSSKDTKASTAAVTKWAAAHPGGAAGTDWSKVLVTPVAAEGDRSYAVVTVVGTDGTEAYAVRLRDHKAKVVTTEAGSIELVTPEPVADDGTPATVSTDDDLVVVLPSGASAPVLRLDDGKPIVCGEGQGSEFAAMDGMDRMRCAWTPSALAPGAHTLTVAFTADDGSTISADSVPFQAA